MTQRLQSKVEIKNQPLVMTRILKLASVSWARRSRDRPGSMKLYTYSRARRALQKSLRKRLAQDKFRSDARTVACTP
jgi:hypothetical protein